MKIHTPSCRTYVLLHFQRRILQDEGATGVPREQGAPDPHPDPAAGGRYVGCGEYTVAGNTVVEEYGS